MGLGEWVTVAAAVPLRSKAWCPEPLSWHVTEVASQSQEGQATPQQNLPRSKERPHRTPQRSPCFCCLSGWQARAEGTQHQPGDPGTRSSLRKDGPFLQQ